jgi:alpha-glucosidase
VPLPWSATAPGFGFSPTGATWLPQPSSWADYAVDAQAGVPGSTLEMYRTALRLRRELGLGTGSLAWVEDLPGTGSGAAGDVVAFVNGDVLVVTNLGTEDVALPDGATVLHASADLAGDGTHVPTDVTVWARLAG